MPFKPGQSGNKKGRPKGAKNKATQTIREALAELLNGISVEQLQADLMELSAKDRLRMIATLAEYVTPKAKAQESQAPDKIEVILSPDLDHYSKIQ